MSIDIDAAETGVRTSAVASTATLTPDADNFDSAVITAQAAALIIAAPTGTPKDTQAFIIRIQDDGTARGITMNAIYRAVSSTLPTTTTLGKEMYISMIYNAGDTKWDVTAVVEEA